MRIRPGQILRMGVFVLLAISPLWGNEEVKTFTRALSSDQKTLLEGFLRHLVKDSFSGYVLYGDKPIALEAVALSDNCDTSIIGEGNPLTTKGSEFWQDLHLSSKNKNYFFLIFDDKEGGFRHLICINRRAFIKAVNENLSLFRYVLGPTLTAEHLLDELIEAKDRFDQVLKDDNVLLGILLGYGKQNALLVSREECITDAFAYDREEDFPYISRSIRKKHSILPKAQKKHPSLGFTTLEEEERELRNLTVVSRNLKHFDSYKIPYFGCEPDSEESKALLAVYEKNREEIKLVCEERDFLEETLSKLFTTTSGALEIPPIPEKRPLLLPQSKDEAARKIVHLIHRNIKKEKYFQQSYLNAFLQGACDRELGTEKSLGAVHKRLYGIYLAKKELACYENLERSTAYFHEVASQKDWLPLVPNRVYYKIHQQGKGDPISSKVKNVTFHYTFHVLDDDDLKDCGTVKKEGTQHFIPGIAHALLGMKRGEQRELAIHPEYGYGEETYWPSNLVIFAKIELVDFEEGDREIALFPPHKLAERNHQELIQKHEELCVEEFYDLGVHFWNFMKKGKDYLDFSTFKTHFEHPQDTFPHEAPWAQFTDDLHWYLLSLELNRN